MLIFLLTSFPSMAQCRTWYVKADSTGDAPTIRAAIDSAEAGDEVLVGPGMYTWSNQVGAEPDWTMISIDKDIWLHSEDGPSTTILDAEGHFNCVSIYLEGVDIQPTIEGFTITGGAADVPWMGAGIVCSESSPTIRGNVVTGNWTFQWGGGLWFHSSNPVLIDNLISDNIAVGRGGGVYCQESEVSMFGNTFYHNVTNSGGGAVHLNETTGVIENNTLIANTATSGAAFYITASSSLMVSSNIIVGSLGGPAFYCDGTSSVVITCNDLWNNAEGDGNCVLGENNFSADPMFCDPGAGDYHLREDSPCAAGNSPSGCGLVGALPVACWDTPIGSISVALALVLSGAAGAWRIARSSTKQEGTRK